MNRIQAKRKDIIDKLHWKHLKKVWWKWWVVLDTWEKLTDFARPYRYYDFYMYVNKFRKKYWNDFVFDKFDKVIVQPRWWDCKTTSFEFFDEKDNFIIVIKTLTTLRKMVSYYVWPKADTVDMCLAFKKHICPMASTAIETKYNWEQYEINLDDNLE